MSEAPPMVSGNPGLQPGQFRRVATAGIGDPGNSYPHSMTWFEDHLYVGTTRHVMALQYNRHEYLKTWDVFPVKPAPDNPFKDLDVRAQIWRYAPVQKTWEKVFTSDLMPEDENGIRFPHFAGVRNMLPFQRARDRKPALYAQTWSAKGGPGPLIYRSEDGRTFEPNAFNGFAAKEFSTFRPLVAFKNRLFTAPTGKTGSANMAGNAIVMETADPVNDEWVVNNELDFGDCRNQTVFEMVAFNNHLYAGTMNPDGLQLWKTDAEGPPPYAWTKVLDRGAWRGPHNEGVGSLCEFNGMLYVGSCISNGGYDRKYGIGPAAVEIVRVAADDSWELVMGEARETPDGLKIPLSGYGPGFDKAFNTYLWRMCAHEGWLYAGTYSISGMLHYLPRERWPDFIKTLLDGERTKLIVDQIGGFDLWRSRDGKTWLPVTRNGFGNPYNWGVRTMQSTPHGLFVGTANPFGPEVAVRRAAGWQYEPNPRGGLEIWQGARQFDPVDHVDGALRAPSQADTRRAVAATDVDPTEAYLEDLIHQFYGETDYRLFGYWGEKTQNGLQASEHLLDELISYLPPETSRLLHLGDQQDSSANYLAQAFPGASVTRQPLTRGSTPIKPPAGRATENCYDAMVSAQALSRTPHAMAWLGEAHRLLAPQGWFVGVEVLSGNTASPWFRRKGLRRQTITTIEAFETLFRESGFGFVEVRDVTSASWQTFSTSFDLFLWERALEYELDEEMVDAIKEKLYGRYQPLYAVVLFAARHRDWPRPTPDRGLLKPR